MCENALQQSSAVVQIANRKDSHLGKRRPWFGGPVGRYCRTPRYGGKSNGPGLLITLAKRCPGADTRVCGRIMRARCQLPRLVETDRFAVMNRRRKRSSKVMRGGTPDWDTLYREGTPPWETGLPAGELVRVVQTNLLPRGKALELGCGTGADAVYLASKGFEVTAVESSPTALDRARTRAQLAGASVRFVLDDVFKFARTCGPYHLVYDAGFYHFIRRHDLDRFLDVLWRVTCPGSYYFALAGATGEEAEGGPPQVSEMDIRRELGRLFEFIHLCPFRFESPHRPEGYLGWSCLLRRPRPAETAFSGMING